MAILLPEPNRAAPLIAQGWCRLLVAKTSHWFRYSGESLCRRWLREDAASDPAIDPEPHTLVCQVCLKGLAAMRKRRA